jgi:phosphate transport system substrate-binding protein
MLRKCLLGATALGVVATLSSAAFAQAITAGGATLPQPLYNAEFSALQTFNVTATPGSTYAVTYYGVGSGAGQKGFLLNDSSKLTNGSTSAPAGLVVAFGGSDAALSNAQYTCWNGTDDSADGLTGCANQQAIAGNLINLPLLGTPVTLAFAPAQLGKISRTNLNTSKAKVTFTPITANGGITLNDDDLCGIFSGKITDWLAASPSTSSATVDIATKPAVLTGTGVSATAPSPIKVVVRSDGSGTTFLFTQHLAAVCTTANTATGVTFTAGTTFAKNFPGNTLPSNFVAAAGSGGVAAALQDTATNPGAIGYLSPDYTTIAPYSTALVAGSKPTLIVAKLKNATTGTAVLPNTSSTTAALKAATTGTIYDSAVKASTANLSTVTPAPSNPVNWVPLVAKPSTGYPIVGYTTVMFAQCYSDPTVAAAVKQFISANVDSTATPNYILSAGPNLSLANNGFVPMPATMSKVIINRILTNYGKPAVYTAKGVLKTAATYWNYDIQNPAACAGLAGR